MTTLDLLNQNQLNHRETIFANTRKYAWVGWTALRSNMAYAGEVAIRFIFLAQILFIFLQLWRVTYSASGTDQLGGLTLPQMLWYLVITESITLSTPRISDEVDQDVRTGALAIQLLRPMSYPLFRLWSALGEQTIRFLMSLVIGSILILLFVGPIPFTLPGLALFVLSLPLAFTLQFLGLFLIGLGAFWLEDTSGLRLLYIRATMILGGLLIPIELFPAILQPILRVLPFASIMYGPARLFVEPDPAFFGRLLLQQGIAIAIYSLVVALVYRVAVKRINANGG